MRHMTIHMETGSNSFLNSSRLLLAVKHVFSSMWLKCMWLQVSTMNLFHKKKKWHQAADVLIIHHGDKKQPARRAEALNNNVSHCWLEYLSERRLLQACKGATWLGFWLNISRNAAGLYGHELQEQNEKRQWPSLLCLPVQTVRSRKKLLLSTEKMLSEAPRPKKRWVSTEKMQWVPLFDCRAIVWGRGVVAPFVPHFDSALGSFQAKSQHASHTGDCHYRYPAPSFSTRCQSRYLRILSSTSRWHISRSGGTAFWARACAELFSEKGHCIRSNQT